MMISNQNASPTPAGLGLRCRQRRVFCIDAAFGACPADSIVVVVAPAFVGVVVATCCGRYSP